MQENGSQIENQNDDLTNTSSTDNEYSKWVDNQGDEVKNVFGFNSSAELVNGRAAMIGFFMLILTELVFNWRVFFLHRTFFFILIIFKLIYY